MSPRLTFICVEISAHHPATHYRSGLE